METDYSPFLHLHEDGSIWWPLLEAVKLGAGYLPLCDDEHDLVPVLRANNNRVRANERTLLSELSAEHWADTYPRMLVRDDTRFVEARSFLIWLYRYLRDNPDAGFPFPVELDRAVKRAQDAFVTPKAEPAPYQSMTVALEPWFARPFRDLPENLKVEVQDKIFVAPWDSLTEAQRRIAAEQSDGSLDPAREPERQFWSDFWGRYITVESQIEALEQCPANTGTDTKLAGLRRELAMVKRQVRAHERNAKRAKLLGSEMPDDASTAARLIAYPKALSLLATQHGATADELAAWVFMGPNTGGLAAYLNANELGAAKRFQYGIGVGTERDFDYIAPLMGCWFREDELRRFAPLDRYLTGTALLERWNDVPGIQAEAFICAKIRESRLMDFHPITGGTQATDPGNEAYPPLTEGLFLLAHVEAIEAEDFPSAGSGQADEAHELSGSLSPVTATRIARSFRVFANDDDANDEWWAKRMADAKRNGLDACRVGAARRGKIGGSLWRPDLVAGWLLDRKTGARGTISDVGIRSGLKRFPGYEQIADDMLFPD